MTILHTLASGSSGNAALLEQDGVCLLLDAGVSCRRIVAALGELGRTLDDLSAILITHTHEDHIAGLQTLSKRWDGPICISEPASRNLMYRHAGFARRLTTFSMCRPFYVDGCQVFPFPTSHDAPGSAGFRIGDFGLQSDSGYITDEAAEALLGVPLLLLESDYDTDMLRSGSYPYCLKRRIMGPEGHLSNDDAARFAEQSAHAGTVEIVLSHLSSVNNSPQTAMAAVSAVLRAAGESPALSVAPRDHVSARFQAPERICKR